MKAKKARRELNRLAGLLYCYRPNERSIIFLDGRWTFEVWASAQPEAPVTLAGLYTTARAKVKEIHEKHINASWYGEMGMRNETYEWSLKHGTN